MKIFKKNQPKDVHEWLVVATKKLVPSAQQRICSEILEHYNEGVAKHQEEGLSETKAQQVALAELGDVYKARKDFSRTYLSEWEAKYLNRILERSEFCSFVRICWSLFIYWLFMQVVIRRGFLLENTHIFNLTVQSLLLVAAPTALVLISKRKSARTILWLRLAAETIGTLGVLFCINDFIGQKPFYNLGYAMWICMFGFWFDLLVRRRLSRKIPNNPPEPLRN